MKKNRSAAYGYYGGVSKAQHYVPPTNMEFVPQPNLATAFTNEDRNNLLQLLQQTSFYAENAQNILMRKTVSSLSGNIDSFVISTSGKPEDIITYTSDTDYVDLVPVNGGFF